MEDHVLSLNSFNMPKVFKATDANYILIIRLLLTEKGTYQSHPDLGVGLKSRYRYNNSEDFLATLKNDITEQINKFLPELYTTNIMLTVKDHQLGIIIEANNGTYALSYNSDTDAIDAAATYVLDDL